MLPNPLVALKVAEPMHSVSTTYPLLDDSVFSPIVVGRPRRSTRESSARPRLDIRPMQDGDRDGWNSFSAANAAGSVYQLAAWKDIIVRSYSHDTQYLVARRSLPRETSDDSKRATAGEQPLPRTKDGDVVGILPLAHVQHWLFGNSLVSLPYCDGAGVLAERPSVERLLIEQALRLADALAVPAVELRQYRPLQCLDDDGFVGVASFSGKREVRTMPGWRVGSAHDGRKVRMVLELPKSTDALMRSFKSKLRSQIRRPSKDGLTVKIDGADLVDDFYRVFAANMRDLGSPVHSKRIIRETVQSFPDIARIFVVYGRGVPMASSMALSFNGTLWNPWASSLRQYSREAPNMLLYWAMLEYACNQQCTTFDFGRSSIDEGTYRFKSQWGAAPQPLYWYRFSRNPNDRAGPSPGMYRLTEYWKRLPVPITRVLGPRIRRYISL